MGKKRHIMLRLNPEGRISRLMPLLLFAAIFGLCAYFAFAVPTLISPANSTWLSNGTWDSTGALVSAGTTANVSFNCTADDTGPNGVNLSLWIGLESSNALAFNSSNQTTAIQDIGNIINISNMPDGKYLWICEQTASKGGQQRAGSNYTLYIDTAKPHTINLGGPSQGVNITTNKPPSSVGFNWTAMDNLAETFLCNLTLDGAVNATIMVSNGSINGTIGDESQLSAIGGISDGVHLWNVTCWDLTNMSSNINTSETRHFTVDTVAPSRIAPGIANSTNFSSSTVYINWTATDATSSVVNCTLVVDDAVNATGIYKAANTLASYSVAGLAEGQHTWYANCSDNVQIWNTTGTLGDYAGKRRAFYVDLTNPVPALTLGSSSIVLRGAQTISCSATDRGAANPAGFTVQLPNGDYSSDLDGTFTDTGVIGAYTVTCSATDNSGRSASTSTTFTVGDEITNAGTGAAGGTVKAKAAPAEEKKAVVGIKELKQGVKTETDVQEKGIAVKKISITPASDAKEVSLNVKAYAELPKEMKEPKGKMYQALEIKLDKEVEIKEAEICFEVEKQWVEENGFNEEDVKLAHYNPKRKVSVKNILREDGTLRTSFIAEDELWEELETEQVKEPAEKTESAGEKAEETLGYCAKTSGFSAYAIIARKEVKEAVEEAKPAAEKKPEEVYMHEKRLGFYDYIFLAVLIDILLIVLTVLVFREGNRRVAAIKAGIEKKCKKLMTDQPSYLKLYKFVSDSIEKGYSGDAISQVFMEHGIPGECVDIMIANACEENELEREPLLQRIKQRLGGMKRIFLK